MLPDKLVGVVKNLKRTLSEKVRRENESTEDIPTKTRLVEEVEKNFREQMLREYKLMGVKPQDCDHPFSDVSGEGNIYCTYCNCALTSPGLYDNAIKRHISFSTDF